MTLRCFSLTGSILVPTTVYDTFIVPLLRGMVNLDELQLYLRVVRYNSTYIDGNQLYDQFLVYMTKLKKFTFDINTKVVNENADSQLPSNEDIEQSFFGKGYSQVISYVNRYSSRWVGECHFYSYPYDFEYYFDLNNTYQSGMFHKVQQLTMNGVTSFECKLFQQISKDFPFLKYLYIKNGCAMKQKPHLSEPMTFSYLRYVNLRDAHRNYASLLLLKKNCHLPRLAHLSIRQESLKKITKNFTIRALYFNFDELNTLDVGQSFVRPTNFHVYFPLLTMCQ